MSLPSGISPFREDEWELDPFAEENGVVGTRLTHYYTAQWDATPASLGWTFGSEMPSRPSGSSATVLRAERIGKRGTTSRVFRVTGFEAKGYS